MSRSHLVAALLHASSAAACTQGVTAHHVLRATHSCVETECTAFSKSQEADCRRCQSQCADLVLQGCSMSTTCGAVCDAESCTERQAQSCTKAEWSWQVPHDETPGVAEACVRSGKARHAACKIDQAEEDEAELRESCSRHARNMAATAIEPLDCLARIGSCSDGGNCFVAGTFGDELCTLLDARCPGTCASEDRDELDALGAHYKPEVVEAAHECTRQAACVDVQACFAAWKNVFY